MSESARRTASTRAPATASPRTRSVTRPVARVSGMSGPVEKTTRTRSARRLLKRSVSPGATSTWYTVPGCHPWRGCTRSSSPRWSTATPPRTGLSDTASSTPRSDSGRSKTITTGPRQPGTMDCVSGRVVTSSIGVSGTGPPVGASTCAQAAASAAAADSTARAKRASTPRLRTASATPPGPGVPPGGRMGRVPGDWAAAGPCGRCGCA